MKKEEIAHILAPLVAAFPHAEFSRPTAATYATYLCDLRPEVLEAAVAALITECDRFPTIAQIRRRCVELENPLPSPEEAWMMLSAYLSETDEERRRELYSALPQEALQALEAVGGFFALQISDNPSADRAQYMRIYSALREKRIQKDARTPRQAQLEERLRKTAIEGRM